MGGVATLSLLIPSAAKLGGHTGYPYYLVIIRVRMGLCEAATFSCTTSMLARWAPEQERATMSTFIKKKNEKGNLVTSPELIRSLYLRTEWLHMEPCNHPALHLSINLLTRRLSE